MGKVYTHEPVMLEECLKALDIKPDGIYVDGTAGLGGHSEAIARRLDGKLGRLICLDKDTEALNYCEKRLDGLPVVMVHSDFRDMDKALDGLNIGPVDGVLLDLGVSSLQLDKPERGFSYRNDAPLDMRMDRLKSMTAEDIINGWPEQELKRILYTFGEERYASRVAWAICKSRPISSTVRLAEIVAGAIPNKKEAQHPARRTFQALRIAVNDELGAVRDGVTAGIKRLKPGGRMAVISFHSLEDRLVKNMFRDGASPCTCPPEFPVCICGKKKELKIIGKMSPSEEETERNSRAASARLRVAEKV